MTQKIPTRRTRNDAKAERNRKIVEMINNGIRQADVARQYGLSRARIGEIYTNPRWNPSLTPQA